jgi:geranylgeranyl reductase family protein
MPLDIIIVGGGPAGAYCALKLAEKGIYATILDGSHPREKPCGGGISSMAQKKFPFLKQFRSQGGSSNSMKIISCTNKYAILTNQKIFNMSRLVLDQKILEMATEKGAKLIKENALDIKKAGKLWEIKTKNQTLTAKVLVGADGANSLFRKKLGPISNKNLGLTFGYYVKGMENEPTTVKYLAELIGFIWIFPRKECSNIGIGSQITNGHLLKNILDHFISTYCPQVEIKSKFAAMIPSATEPSFFDMTCAGKNWLLIGDAAGHVNPLSGEGILYALWSAKLAAKAIAKNDLSSYNMLWKKEYGETLKQCCQQKNIYFNPLTIEFAIANMNKSSKTAFNLIG